jgi:hypothetical protein
MCITEAETHTFQDETKVLFLPNAYFLFSCYLSRSWKTTLKQWERRNEQSILCGRQAVALKYGKQIRINEANFVR